MRNREWGNHSGLPMSTESSLQMEGGTDASLWWSWYDTVLQRRRAWPSVCQTWQMVGFGLRTLLCKGWACLPSWRCLVRLDPGSGKWLRAVGLGRLHWRSSPECFSAWLMELVNASLGLGKATPISALGHEIVACGRELVGVVVRASLADSECASLGSMLVLSVDGSVSGHSSSSHRGNVLKKCRSKFVQGLPSPDRGLRG